MSVIGIYCQICGAPIQHVCCVPVENGFFIFRGKPYYKEGKTWMLVDSMMDTPDSKEK